MKHCFKLFLALLALSTSTFAQQGMGVGNNNPLEMLDVSGAIKVGTDNNNSNAAPTGGAGTIRFKAGAFQGWDGTFWIPLGGGADTDWTISGNNQYSTVSGNVGIGVTNPAQKLEVIGNIRMVDGNQATGFIPVSDANGTMTWTDPTTITTASIFELNGTDVRLNATEADPATSNFVFGSPQMDDDTDGTHDKRMFFNKTQAAFRAGETDEDQWDAANIGELSAAFGKDNTASGKLSFALGRRATTSGLMSFAAGEDVIASGEFSVAMGSQSEATNFGSVAVGYRNHATGLGSVALGRQTFARSAYETTVGMFSEDYTPSSTLGIIPTDRLFTVGNGTGQGSSRSNALVILKNGNTGIGSSTPAEKLHVAGSIRMVDGNQQAGFIPVSDANGKMIWTNPSSITTTVQTNISDADNDTKIQVEKNADEDIIRFDLGGTEQLKISNNANGAPLFEVNSVGGNLYIGKSSGNVDTGTLNTFIGQYAGDVHASGNLNTFLGSDAGRNHSGGGDNIFLGARAGWFNSNGVR